MAEPLFLCVACLLCRHQQILKGCPSIDNLPSCRMDLQLLVWRVFFFDYLIECRVTDYLSKSVVTFDLLGLFNLRACTCFSLLCPCFQSKSLQCDM